MVDCVLKHPYGPKKAAQKVLFGPSPPFGLNWLGGGGGVEGRGVLGIATVVGFLLWSHFFCPLFKIFDSTAHRTKMGGWADGEGLEHTTKMCWHKAGPLKMNTALEYSTRVVQEGGRRCNKSTLNDLLHLTPLRIPLMNPPIDFPQRYLYHQCLFRLDLRVMTELVHAAYRLSAQGRYVSYVITHNNWYGLATLLP